MTEDIRKAIDALLKLAANTDDLNSSQAVEAYEFSQKLRGWARTNLINKIRMGQEI